MWNFSNPNIKSIVINYKQVFNLQEMETVKIIYLLFEKFGQAFCNFQIICEVCEGGKFFLSFLKVKDSEMYYFIC